MGGGRAPGRPPVLVAVLAAAVIAAWTLTLDRPGLGWLLTGLALAAVTVAAAVEPRVRPDLPRCLWAGPVLVFTPAEWSAFVEGAKAGEFDRS